MSHTGSSSEGGEGSRDNSDVGGSEGPNEYELMRDAQVARNRARFQPVVDAANDLKVFVRIKTLCRNSLTAGWLTRVYFDEPD